MKKVSLMSISIILSLALSSCSSSIKNASNTTANSRMPSEDTVCYEDETGEALLGNSSLKIFVIDSSNGAQCSFEGTGPGNGKYTSLNKNYPQCVLMAEIIRGKLTVSAPQSGTDCGCGNLVTPDLSEAVKKPSGCAALR